MFLRNCWYAAGHSHEIGQGFLARKFLNQATIIWRTAQGKLAALEDRCPHRLVPLSTGKIVNDQIECGYHGLRFGGDGACAFVPGQDSVPKNSRAKTFPVAERHALIWIWMGAHDLADENLIPDVHWMDAPGWTASKGYHHFKCNYRLINDNLLDLSHETYIHKHTVGGAAVADSPVISGVVAGRLARAHREMPDIEPPPFFALAQGHNGRINRWQIAIYMAPGFNMTEVGFHATGTERAKALLMRPLHLITPETEHSSHYIWGVPRNFKLDDEKLTAGIGKAGSDTFDEDRALLELQQQCLQAEEQLTGVPPQVPQTAVRVDIAPVQGRRLLADALLREKDDPRAVLSPVALADDAIITMPVAVAAE